MTQFETTMSLLFETTTFRCGRCSGPKLWSLSLPPQASPSLLHHSRIHCHLHSPPPIASSPHFHEFNHGQHRFFPCASWHIPHHQQELWHHIPLTRLLASTTPIDLGYHLFHGEPTLPFCINDHHLLQHWQLPHHCLTKQCLSKTAVMNNDNHFFCLPRLRPWFVRKEMAKQNLVVEHDIGLKLSVVGGFPFKVLIVGVADIDMEVLDLEEHAKALTQRIKDWVIVATVIVDFTIFIGW